MMIFWIKAVAIGNISDERMIYRRPENDCEMN